MGNPTAAIPAGAPNSRSNNGLDSPSGSSNRNNSQPSNITNSSSSNNNAAFTTSSTAYQTAASASASATTDSQLSNDVARTVNNPQAVAGEDTIRPNNAMLQQNLIQIRSPVNLNEQMPYIYTYPAQPPHPQQYISSSGVAVPTQNQYAATVFPMHRAAPRPAGTIHRHQVVCGPSGFPVETNFVGGVGPRAYFPPQHYGAGGIVGPNHNGMMRSRPGAAYYHPTPPQRQMLHFRTIPPAHTQKNQETNLEFSSLIKNALGDSTPPTKNKDTRASPRKSAESVVANVTEKRRNSVDEQRNELRDIFKGLVVSDHPSSGATRKGSKERKTSEVAGEQKSPQQSSPRASVNQTAIDFSNIIKNVAHGESPPIVTCEFGAEVGGLKTYKIEEMLSIRSTLAYDVARMVQTLSKFRIAVREGQADGSERVWRTIAEKKKLGLVTDKEVFTHSLLQVLNKISSCNFYQNWASFRALSFTSPDLVTLYSKLLFDKAVAEHSWLYVYMELIRISHNFFSQMYSEEGYAALFLDSLMECANKYVVRNLEEEQAIRDMKKITSKDIDTIDKVIGDTAERENKYRKIRFGVLLFISYMFYEGFVEQDYIDRLLEQLKKDQDSLGIELYARMIENTLLRYVESNNRQALVASSKRIDELKEYVDENKKNLTSKARFAMMDVFKHRQEDYKTVESRKRVPKPSESSNARTTSNASGLTKSSSQSAAINSTGGHDSLGRKQSAFDANPFSRSDRSTNRMNSLNRGRDQSRHKNDFNDSRRPNPDAFYGSNKFKGYNKTRGSGQSMGNSVACSRYLSMGRGMSVSLDDDNSTFPTNASNFTSRTSLESKQFSLLKRPTAAATVADNNKASGDQLTSANAFDKPSNKNTERSIVRSATTISQVPSARTSSVDQSKRIPSQETSSFDVDDGKGTEIRNLEETALNLISNFHLSETNVSRFIIELSGYALSDRMDILVKEAFKYYNGVSHGHYAFGMLLSELMGRYPELVETVKANLAEQLVELPLNALDEPVLWDYFYLTVLPMLSSVRITLDDLHQMLCKVPDVDDADGTIVSMLVLGEKRLSKYDVVKMVAKQTGTAVWKRVVADTKSLHADTLAQISKKLQIISDINAKTFLHWVDLLLDVNYDASYVTALFTHFYATPDEGLRDLAKCLYLYSSIGDNFTNDLITIFSKRNKKLMDELFGTNSSQKLLTHLAEIFAQFKFTPNGVIVDIGVPLYKNDHVDKEWLNSWRQQEDKPYDSTRVDPDIYRIIKSRSD